MSAAVPDGQNASQQHHTEAANRRSQLKSDRRSQLLSAAERLFAERGFLAVRLDDIGAAAGVSGPAIYRHFPSKESLLVELLVGISTQLLAGARDVTTRSTDTAAALEGLIEFHLNFAVDQPNLIRIQDRDLAYLPAPAQRQVRRAQREYVEIWVGVLHKLNPQLAEADARLIAHAVFGLLNSTPHSMKSIEASPSTPAREARTRAVMRAMTRTALTVANNPPTHE
ncbi:MAG: TetR/AcrR family transcriptional regulator [Mycobacteriaceae bacterium]|nr:TetR/AcrR family transcriptional regulator [Mycobacteriaceae bacterium]